MVKPLTINLLWTIAVLIMIVAAFAVIAPGGALLQNYISFASAIASILLALVAIGYSFISNSSLSNTLGDLRSATQSLAEQTTRLNAASSGLSDEAEEILKKLSDLPEHVTQFRGEVAKKIDDLTATKIQDQSPEASGVSKSLGHALALYLIARAKQAGRSFVFEELFSDDSMVAPRYYCQGVIEALQKYSINGVRIEGIEGKYYVADLGGFDGEGIISRTQKVRSDPDNNLLDRSVVEIDKYFEGRKSLNGDDGQPADPVDPK